MSSGYSIKGALIAGKMKAKQEATAARYRSRYYSSSASQKAKEKQIAKVLEAMKILSGKDNNNATEEKL